MRRTLFIALLLFSAAMVAAAILHVIKADQKVARMVRQPIPVETLPAKVVTLKEVIGASGNLRQNDTISLTARLSARIDSVPVDIGNIVRQGATLLEFDDRLFNAAVESATQAVAAARVAREHDVEQLRRVQKLYDQKMGSAVDVEEAKATLAKAQQDEAAAAQLRTQATIDLENTKVTAPVNCAVLDRMVNPGEGTQLGQAMFKLGTIDSVLMVAQVAEEKVGAITLGLPGEIGLDSFPGEIFKGEVVKIDLNTDPATHAFAAYLRIPNPDLRLRPGLTGFSRIYRQKTNLAIPNTAVMNPVGDHASVFVVDDTSHAHLRAVRTGIVAEGMTEILSGLSEGERVVTVGQLYLKENDVVPAKH